jgi:hypothetical protein
MRELRLELPRPHPAQRLVIEEAKRFNVCVNGRRWGKTVLGLDRLVAGALQGLPTSWWAPSYRTLQDTWREASTTLAPVIIDKSESEHRLQLTGGGTVEFWSTDAAGDSARGRKYGLAVVDEAAMVANLEQFWQATLRPMLADLRGSAWFLSTPKGMNYFKTLFDRGQDAERTDWASWQMATRTNPYIAAEEIEAAREDMTDSAFAQEFEAAFISWEGQVFRRIFDAIAAPPDNVPAVAIGVDWARTRDFTAFVAVSTSGQVLAIERFRGVEYSLQRARLRAFWERLGGQSWIFAETNNMGGPVVEQLQRDGLPVCGFTTTNATKAAIIENLSLGFERGVIKIPNDPALIGELQTFEARPLPSGLMRYAAADTAHDDLVMALALAWEGLGLWERQRRAQPRQLYLNPNGPGFTTEPPDFEAMQISPY